MYTQTVHYGSAKNFCPLVRRVTDFFTGQFNSAIDGASLLNGAPDDTLEHINQSIEGIELFRKAYNEFKKDLNELENSETGPPSLTLVDQAVVSRFLTLCSRVDKIGPIIQSIVEYSKFEKTEVGGTHGHILSPRFTQLLEEFGEVESKLSAIEFDLLSIPDEQFKIEIEKIQRYFETLDSAAVSIAIWATEDCNSIVSIGQILSGFGSLINRKNFIDEIQRQYPTIIKLYQEDIDLIGASYRAEKESLPQMFGVPATTSALLWSGGLSTRLSQSREALNSTIPQIFEVPEMMAISENTEELQEEIDKTTQEKK
jgi:hypothetical protein